MFLITKHQVLWLWHPKSPLEMLKENSSPRRLWGERPPAGLGLSPSIRPSTRSFSFCCFYSVLTPTGGGEGGSRDRCLILSLHSQGHKVGLLGWVQIPLRWSVLWALFILLDHIISSPGRLFVKPVTNSTIVSELGFHPQHPIWTRALPGVTPKHKTKRNS